MDEIISGSVKNELQAELLSAVKALKGQIVNQIVYLWELNGEINDKQLKKKNHLREVKKNS